MPDRTVSTDIVSIGSKDALTEILRQGAQQMLARAIENEVVEYLGRYADQCDDSGKRPVVRNGYLPARNIQTAWAWWRFASRVSTTSAEMNRASVFGSPVRFSRRICDGPRVSMN